MEMDPQQYFITAVKVLVQTILFCFAVLNFLDESPECLDSK